MKGVMDSILQRYEMKFELSPARVINKHGIIVQKQSFDLREEVLKAQENLGSKRVLFTRTSPNT